MADIDLTQEEADALIAMPKCRVNEDIVFCPSQGKSVTIPLVSEDKRENFSLDIRCGGRICQVKATYQNRVRQTVVLIRLDLGGAPHRNPDGEEIACPHLHVYREGYGAKWAKSISADRFSNCMDLWETLQDFMSYCNITKQPNIQRGIDGWKRYKS
jgi:hypothetical protein